MMKNTNTIIRGAYNLIKAFDEAAAKEFLHKPFKRVDLAYCFANGLRNGKDVSSDIHPIAKTVIEVALLDREQRQAANAAVMQREQNQALGI